jgi:hypothetical protein
MKDDPTLRVIAVCVALLLAPVFAQAASLFESTKGSLTRHLQARLAAGDLGNPNCAAVSGNVRASDQGFDDIRFELRPGAYRIVVPRAESGWRMTWGVPELMLFTHAGFFTMTETAVNTPAGASHPAREFRLTRKGYEALARPDMACFEYQVNGGVEVVSMDEVPTPERLSGFGRAYRVRYRLDVARAAGWADSPEFRYIYTKIYNSPNPSAGSGAVAERTFIYNEGRWWDPTEMMQLAYLDSTTLQHPNRSEQVEHARKRLAENAPEARAARIAELSSDKLRAALAGEKERKHLEPCLDVPLGEADLALGFWKKDMPPALVFYDPPRRKDARRESALEFARRLEKTGLARAEPFVDEPAPGMPKGKGVRYVLAETATAALDRERQMCLPLGETKIESLRVVQGMPGQAGPTLRGWGRLVNPRPWTERLAAQFPNVRTLLDQGYGLTGTLSGQGGDTIRVSVEAPRYALKEPQRPYPFPATPAPADAPAIEDRSPDGIVRMTGDGCGISTDGTEVRVGTVQCGSARATRGFRRGKAYAEIEFHGKRKGAGPDTWTNAAVTSPRALSSVSTGSALFSFAGSFTRGLVKDGDVIGVALDMDERVLYWHLNGEWKSARPGSGLGEPMVETGEYFIAVSVQDKAESWKVNFGATPFRYPPPAGYPAYGARQVSVAK